MDNQLIAKRLKYVRNLKGVTLEDIAQNVGLAKSTVQRYETGKIDNIKLPVIQAISNYLSVNPAWIVGKSEEMELHYSAPAILDYYNQLNTVGKEEAEKRVKELTFIPDYTYSAPVLMAAHDDDNSPEEIDKVRSDLAMLKRPE